MLPMKKLIALNLREAREEFEREYYRTAAAKHQGNMSAIAEHAGVERASMHRRFKQLGIEDLSRGMDRRDW